MGWIGRWARRSHERSLDNARNATTALSRLRVERQEVELFCLERYAAPSRPALVDVRVAGAAR